MPKAKIAIALDVKTLRRLDEFVDNAHYPSRSQAVEAAIRDHLERLDRGRLGRECAKLDSRAEKAMAEEGMTHDAAEWPEY